ncbi:MAG: hypothetical protein IEMM0006_2245 [bacterium]|nr:MAG: hypothetical protein IEMM0006_2245 [bacterium]
MGGSSPFRGPRGCAGFFSMSILKQIDTSIALSLWNKFIASLPVPAPFSFNPSLFSFYQTCFHWKPYYFFLYSEEKLVAVFPLVNTGKRWVSLPHFSYGGMVLNENSGLYAEIMIESLIISIEIEKITPGFFQVDVKNRVSRETLNRKLYIRSLHSVKNELKYNKITSVIHLPESQKEFFHQLSSNLRRKIHKAESSNFSVKRGKQELLDDFYAVYAKNMYRLGSPAYGKHFFSDLMTTYEFGETLFFVIYKEKKPVAASMLMSYNGFWENTWFSTKKETQKEYVSDFLHWQMIQYAIRRHASIYSFGRSDADGNVFQYKNHWPVENTPVYEYALNQRINIKNYKWLTNLWCKIPYPVAYYLGPGLVRHIY